MTSLTTINVELVSVLALVLKTICAIANICPDSDGMIFIGVADKETDADRIKALDGVEPSQVGTRWIVGIDREAYILRVCIEKYYQRWREKIDKSGISQHLKTDVLSNIDMCLYEGRHILIISVPRQSEVVYSTIMYMLEKQIKL